MSHPLPEDVRAALAGGKKIEAIRLLLQAKAAGSKPPKAAVGDAARMAALKSGTAGQGGQSGEGPSPGEVPRSKLSPGLVALVLVLALAAWLLLKRA